MTISEQARADAAADAETLRLMAGSHERRNNTTKNLMDSGRMAELLQSNLWFKREDAAQACAVYSARFAFRAVPGLRG